MLRMSKKQKPLNTKMPPEEDKKGENDNKNNSSKFGF